MVDDFKDRYGPVAVVTGASSGIGFAFAEELAERGFDLILAARRVDKMQELATRLEQAHGVRVDTHEIDLGAADGPAKLVAATAGRDVGLVISNAGFGFKGAHETAEPAMLTEMLMVNCNAPMLLAQAFLPQLKQRGKGGLIMTSSVEGLIGCPWSAGYSASKAMVVALGEALWGEAQGTGVDVLTLCPGATESEAAAKQGIDLSKLENVMSAREVACVTLDNITEGPTFVSSPHYRQSFEQLTALPRRQALTAMAGAMRPPAST